MLSCGNKTTYLKPETVTIYVDKYVPVPEKLTAKSEPIYIQYPIWLKTATWLDLHYENQRTIEHCNLKLKLIKKLKLPEKNDY